MTIDEYAVDSGGLEEYSGPPEDPETHAMIEHLVEFDTEMFRLDCRRKYKGLSYKHLEMLMVELHGREWRDAL
jgi:hypothetical protein